MPMIPSVLAVAAYAAIKVVGYAAFAHGTQRVVAQPVSPYRFGFAKTGIGLAGGMLYLFALVPLLQVPSGDSTLLFLGAIPVRAVAWAIAIGIFFGYRQKLQLKLLAVALGVAWSYALDGIMSLLYQILPGMNMPFC